MVLSTLKLKCQIKPHGTLHAHVLESLAVLELPYFLGIFSHIS